MCNNICIQHFGKISFVMFFILKWDRHLVIHDGWLAWIYQYYVSMCVKTSWRRCDIPYLKYEMFIYRWYCFNVHISMCSSIIKSTRTFLYINICILVMVQLYVPLQDGSICVFALDVAPRRPCDPMCGCWAGGIPLWVLGGGSSSTRSSQGVVRLGMDDTWDAGWVSVWMRHMSIFTSWKAGNCTITHRAHP